MNKPMVFCCYTDLKNKFSKESKELISLWQKSWFDHGWNPIILSRSDAQEHADYTDELWGDNSNIMRNSNPSCPFYTRTCYERWFAYASQANKYDIIHWADYDVINYDYSADEALVEDCKFDPSYCCGILTKEKAQELIGNIIKYAFADFETFNSLNLPHNNDMFLLDRLKILPLNHICSNPADKKRDYCLAKLTHFHGGSASNFPKELELDKKTRLEIVQILRPYE